jgi:hypothetical protein
MEPVSGAFDATQVALATIAVRGGLPCDALAPQLRSGVEQLGRTGENLSVTRSTEVLTYRTVQAVGMETVSRALEVLAAAVAVGVDRPSTTWALITGVVRPWAAPSYASYQ